MEQIPKMTTLNNATVVYLKFAILFSFFMAVFWRGGISSILTVPRYLIIKIKFN